MRPRGVSPVMRWSFTGLDTARWFALGGRAACPHAAAVRLAVLVLLAACGASAPHGGSLGSPHGRTTGAIAGLARDHDTGDPIALAEIRIAAGTSTG